MFVRSSMMYGANFVVVTDNNPLTYLSNFARLDGASHRWLAALSTYTFKLQYHTGKHNLDADALSSVLMALLLTYLCRETEILSANSLRIISLHLVRWKNLAQTLSMSFAVAALSITSHSPEIP